jgi:hypothetical protein
MVKSPQGTAPVEGRVVTEAMDGRLEDHATRGFRLE